MEARKGYHRELLVWALLGRPVALQPPLEAGGHGGLEVVELKVPSHQMAGGCRPLVGKWPVVVGHNVQAPHSMWEERKRLLPPAVVEAAPPQAALQNPDEERRGQWAVVALPKEDKLRTGSAVAQRN